MKALRFIAVSLAAFMLLPSLASCASNGSESGETNATTTVSKSEAETEVRDDLPADLNYGGDEIVIFSRYRAGWTSGEISVPKLNNDPVNDAVYERNKLVEQRLGVSIVNIPDSGDEHSTVAKAETLIKAGTHEYDIVAAPCISTLPKTLDGLFRNLRENEYIDLDKSYWTQGYNEILEYKGTQYAVTGSMLLSFYRFAFVTLFNHQLFKNRNQPLLYDHVKNGTWTLDKQAEITALFFEDRNGNGNQDLDTDVFGLLSSNVISVDPYWSACNVDIMGKNEDGEYEFVFDSGKLQDVADKVIHLFTETNDGGYCLDKIGGDLEQDQIRATFANGKSAMVTLRILELENAEMRSMVDIFGVIPMPKYDEAQEKHYTYLHDQVTVLCIPTTIQQKRFDEVGAVMEAMSSESYHTVQPKYYQENLRTKLVQNPQSAEMIGMIMDNVRIDAGILYTIPLDWFYRSFREVIQTKQNNIVSRYKRITVKTEKLIGDINTKLDQLIEE